MQSVLDREAERLSELRATQILDSRPAPDFDAIVAHARDLFRVPICLVSLIDRDRQWFKAASGLDISETPRDMAFCNYTIQSHDVLVVEDATRDRRFASNALVVGKPGIRFYAGAPLIVRPGIALGSLCVIDVKPRKFSGRQRLALQRLALVVCGLIRGHKLAAEAVALANEANSNRRFVEEQSRELQARERRFKQTERVARIGGWEYDINTQKTTWSDEIYRIHDIPLGAPVTFEDVFSMYAPPERERFDAMLAQAVTAGRPCDGQFELVTASGLKKWVHIGAEVEIVEGKSERLIGILQDISEKHCAQIKLWEAANRDSLTGLANRKQFTALLEDIANWKDEAALLMVDVDHLKKVNDTLGHAAGDALIQTVATRLAQAIPREGFVARLGGDEFAVILPRKCASADLAAAGNAILQAMRPEFIFADRALTPQVCIGGAALEPGDTAETLYKKADLALYHAKQTQRGTFAEFRDELQQPIIERFHILRQVEEGLRDGRIVPYYQPVMILKKARTAGFEVHARLTMKDGRIVRARQFQDAFRDFNLARRLTDQMFEKVAADVRGWLDSGIAFPQVGINLTSADLRDAHLPARLANAFSGAGVPIKHVIIEITETMVTDDRDKVIAKRIESFRRDGVLVALDDFGTGQASLTHLQNAKVDIIKINPSFISTMLSERSGGAIVDLLLELGRRLGVKIVADGIETQAQFDHLLRLGCDFGQGSYFAPVMDRDAATRLLDTFGRRRAAGPRDQSKVA